MSKKNSSRLTALCAALLLTLIALAPATTAQQPPSSVGSRHAAVVAATEQVLRETSEIRQLAILRPVRSGAQSRDEIERMIIRNLERNTRPEEMRAAELALGRLGLVPAGFQYRPFIIRLLREQVAGYYDPREQQFFLADWIALEGQEPIMAHELTHALQDQHFNLRRFEDWPQGDSDAELAAHALVEGDAMLTMSLYAQRSPARMLAMLRSAQASENDSRHLRQAPRALRETLLFPYEQGFLFARQLHRNGGWARVSQAYRDLPQSTEQVLHPEKYFTREAPVRVELPDISSSLGQGWRRIDYDVNGEWGLYLILDHFLQAERDSRSAAAGWGGDRYAVYEGTQSGQVMISMATVWDTEQDAIEFFNAYARRTALRYPGAQVAGGQPEEAGLRRAWRTNEGGVRIERRGPRVLILEGLPATASADALLATLWR